MCRSSMKRPRPRAEDFTLGWICALHIELTAAKAVLDEEYEGSDDATQYTLGRIGRHNVVVSCLPAGQIGTSVAAAVATEMRAKFPSLHMSLMVGIGGGVPSLEADIRLGDVVISVPQGTYGGVVQYDSGKTVSAGLQMRTGSLNTPSSVLLTAVSNLRANINAGRSDIPKYLASIAHLPGFARRDAGPDILFRSSYPHTEGTTCSECREDMVIGRPQRDSEQVVIHYGTIASGNQLIKDALERDRLSAELGVVLCFEMEAAGLMNILQCLVVRGICDYADSHKNKRWQRFAAAAAAACAKEILSFVPAPIQHNALHRGHIRQSSMLDGSESIRIIEPHNQSLEITSDANTLVRRSILTAEQRKRCLDALKFEQIETRHATIKTAHIKTCRWLLTKSEYRGWLDDNKLSEHHGLFWIKGNPGTGKSTIMKFAFTNATRNARKDISNTIVISFFFNARGEELEKSVLGMYRSLLVQLLEKTPDLQDVFDSIRLTALNDNEFPTWDVEIVKSLFQHSVEKLGQRSLICFIDALDECDEDQVREMVAFFEELGFLAVSSQLQFRVCFSSRHYPYIIIGKGIELLLDGQEGHYQDIANYVHSELKGGHEIDQIKAEIIEKASGIFLWVALVIPMLNKEYARGRMRALRDRLREIPKGLDELFKSILTRDRQDIERLILCLQWILFARRPLKREELYFAILAGAEPEALKAWDLQEDTEEAVERYILNSSKGLAEMTKATKSKGQTIQFIHESVRDFLLKGNGLSEIWPDVSNNFQGKSHERLKQCCLNYMGLDISSHIDINKSLPKASSQEAVALRKLATDAFPFLEYATRNILYHADVAEGSGISQGSFIQSFQLAYWVKLDNLVEKHEVRRHSPNVSLLYILAEGNMSNLIRVHPSILSCLEVEDERYGPPLFASLATGSQEAVQTFLKAHGANPTPGSQLHELCNKYSQDGSRQANLGRDFKFSNRRTILSYIAELGNDLLFSCLLETGKFVPDSKDKDGRTPLWQAVHGGHEAVVKLLLETGMVDVDSKDNDGRTPLWWAANGGHEAVVKLLLETGTVDIDSKDNDGRTPLWWAANRGHEAVVKLLLETGMVNVNSKDNNGQTPISWAAHGGHEAVVKLLLKTGMVDINSKDNNGQTLLLQAADQGHEAVVKLLLETATVNVNLKDNNGQTPLWRAVYGVHEAVVKLLLETGMVDINSKDNDGQTPLWQAAYQGNEAVVKLLLETDIVNINLKDNDGRTLLSRAADQGHEAVVKLLLETGTVDIDSKDNNGRTPLWWAANRGHEAVVRLLLETGMVNINSRDNNGQIPLSRAAYQGNEAVVKLLLETGIVDVNLKDNSGQIPLSWAADRGHEAVVKLLLETGIVTVDSKDNDSLTPLSRAAYWGHGAIVKLLLETGIADINSRDNDGRTPLCLAVYWTPPWSRYGGNEVVVKLLLETGMVDVDSKDISGRTPLSRAAYWGHEAIVKLLLETGMVDINSKDNNGQTPLWWAADQGHEAVVKLLQSSILL